MKFSHRTNWPIDENPLSKKASELRRRNVPLLDLTVSNPTVCGFDYFNDELLKPLLDPKNLVYDPNPHGIMSTREAVGAYYREKGIELQPDQIFITANTSEAYTFLFRMLCDPGDQILAPRPSYPLFDFLTDLNDLEPARYALLEEEAWRIDFKTLPDLKNKRLKVFLTVNPNNPTGSYVKDFEREFINEFCEKVGCAIVADEVFFDYLIDDALRPQSFAANDSVLTFTLSGISKTLGLPQMKLSWIVVTGPEKEKREAIRRLEIISDTFLSAGTPAQNALADWMDRRKDIQKEILVRLRENGKILPGFFESANGLKSLPLEGGWNAVLKIPQSMSDDILAQNLLEKEKALVHPGYLFDFQDERHLVLSLLIPPENFRKGIELCGAFLLNSRSGAFTKSFDA